MLSERLSNLLSLLSQDKYQTAKYLGQKLDLSTKTIRNLLKRLDEELMDNGAGIIIKHGIGSKLEVYNLEKFNRIFAQQRTEIPSIPEERVQYLLEFFLSTEHYVKKEVLSERLCISSKTLTSDLKKVEEVLKRYNIMLERKPYHGMKVIGDEFALRLCIAECLEKRTKTNAFVFNEREREAISLIRDCMLFSLETEKHLISDIAMNNLIVHIYIAIKRIREGHYVYPMYEGEIERDEKGYQMAEKCLKEIGAQFDIVFPKEEVAYLAIHLAGKKITDGLQENLVISTEIRQIVDDMLEEVYRMFRIDFRNDLELIVSLGQHLVPLLVRLKYGMHMKNPILEDIKKRYSLAYIMATQAAVVIRKITYKDLNSDEIGYFALAFALALERHRTTIEKKSVLLVCSSGVGSARLLVFKIKENFGNYIDQVHTCDLRSVGRVNFSEIDYIFTTVPIDVPVPVPVCEVGNFMNDNDIYEMKRMLNSGSLVQDSIIEYYPEMLFFRDVDIKTKDGVIRFLCDEIAKKKKIPDHFYESVMKREKLAKTSFGNRVAMPHPYSAMTDESFVAVCLLKESIMWYGEAVQVVFLVSIKENENAFGRIKMFYKVTSQLLLSEFYIDQLIEAGSYVCLINILTTLENHLGGEINGI